jgi:predicted phosphodiesterase
VPTPGRCSRCRQRLREGATHRTCEHCRAKGNSRPRDHAREAELARERKARAALAFDIDVQEPEPCRAAATPPTEEQVEFSCAPGPTVERVLLVPDVHRPYHDRTAWQVMLQAARVWRPDVLVVMGDFADFYAVSSHSKNPNRRRMLEDEVADVNTGLDELDALGARRRYYVSGNHEDRLERYLMDRAPELFNMVRIKDLFRLRERGWTFIPYKRHLKVGRLHVTHDTGRAGRYAHYQGQADFGGANLAIGHTHRLGYMVEGSAQGEPHVAAQFGWLGDFAQVDYMHRVRAMRDWAHGFGVGLMEPSGNIHLQPVPIVGHSCVVGGQLVTLDWRAA